MGSELKTANPKTSDSKTPVQPEGALRTFGEPAIVSDRSAGQKSGRRRLPLGRKGRRLSYDLRLRLWLTALAWPVVGCVGLLVYVLWSSLSAALGAALVAALAYAVLAGVLFEGITRPLETLSNVVSAMREEDFSFRARGAAAVTRWLIWRLRSIHWRARCRHSAARHAMRSRWPNGYACDAHPGARLCRGSHVAAVEIQPPRRPLR